MRTLSVAPQSLQMNARRPGSAPCGAISATSCIVRLHRLQAGLDSSITLNPRCSELGLSHTILEKLGPRPEVVTFLRLRPLTGHPWQVLRGTCPPSCQSLARTATETCDGHHRSSAFFHSRGTPLLNATLVATASGRPIVRDSPTG